MPPVQLEVTISLPEQNFPPLTGLGFVQVRRRWWRQSGPQFDHDDQDVHRPSTAEKENISVKRQII